MKIIDVHAHTGRWLFHTRITDRDILPMLEHFNIEKAVFSSGTAVMYDLSYGNEENYRFIKNDNRCYGYVFVNPNHLKESEEELKKYLGKEKIMGVKMHPAIFNHPVNSEANKELLKIIDSYGLIILIHTEHSDVARPSRILEIAREFPNNKYIIAHMGCAWWKEAVETASKSDNIYTEIVSSYTVYDQIQYACNILGAERVLFGSDLTLLDPSLSIGAVMSSEVSDEDKDKIFYENAMNLFKF